MIDDLFGALSLAVFERRADGLFDALGRLPEWLALESKAVDLTASFPLLEMFFEEWNEKWDGHSDVWTEQGSNGAELYLQAVATTVDARKFLAIKSLPALVSKRAASITAPPDCLSRPRTDPCGSAGVGPRR